MLGGVRTELELNFEQIIAPFINDVIVSQFNVPSKENIIFMIPSIRIGSFDFNQIQV